MERLTRMRQRESITSLNGKSRSRSITWECQTMVFGLTIRSSHWQSTIRTAIRTQRMDSPPLLPQPTPLHPLQTTLACTSTTTLRLLTKHHRPQHLHLHLGPLCLCCRLHVAHLMYHAGSEPTFEMDPLGLPKSEDRINSPPTSRHFLLSLYPDIAAGAAPRIGRFGGRIRGRTETEMGWSKGFRSLEVWEVVGDDDLFYSDAFSEEEKGERSRVVGSTGEGSKTHPLQTACSLARIWRGIDDLHPLNCPLHCKSCPSALLPRSFRFACAIQLLFSSLAHRHHLG
ncbi:hypothetical protein BT69DRAFT_1027261 [Atractiella rhizophila]|nr:hypothetical protein BT69DRAFT_1027261 [Atractiella rhizophila]